MTYALAHQPVGYLGQVSEGSSAGPINGVQLLLADLRDVAARGREFMQPGFSFSLRRYESMMSTFKPREGEDEDETVERVRQRFSTMTSEEVQTLIAGTVGSIGEAVVRATAISQVKVSTDEQRAKNHAMQATIIDPARLMWDMLSQMLRNMEAQQSRATSGLGIAPVIAIALIAAGAVLGVAAIAAGTYLADAYYRTQYASQSAQSICRRAGGCTPEQETNIRRQLQLGPFDGAFQEFGRAAGSGLSTTIAVVGIGAGALVLGAVWYYGFDGKEWLQEKMAERRRRAS